MDLPLSLNYIHRDMNWAAWRLSRTDCRSVTGWPALHAQAKVKQRKLRVECQQKIADALIGDEQPREDCLFGG